VAHNRESPRRKLARPFHLVGLTLVGVSSLFHHAASANPPESRPAPRAAVGRKNGEIRLDGILDEAAWIDAGLIPDLAQQSPHPGEPTPFHTQVRLLADEDHLYLGIVCSDPEPERIAVHTLSRDGDLTGDDSVAFVIDPFGDHRNGYQFRVNAAGARQDGLISGSAEPSLDWDGIWDARVSRSASGWSAEIALPSRTLRFDTRLPAWGFNAERFVARSRTTLRWSGTTLDSSLADLRRAGSLEGLGGLEQGVGLSAAPYGLARATTDFSADRSSLIGQAGIDVTYNLTPGVATVLTVNPDFAETEVDTRQINLTRFPLFFPEKRPFFLEGSDLFEFGLDLGTDFIPFFSRRVGLFDGNRVPLRAGVKILGRAGRFSVAALDTLTGDVPSAPGTNLFAGRVTFDADEHLRIGAISTRGDPDGVHANWLGGLDAVWKTSSLFGSKNFSVGGWGARSGGDVPDGRRGGWGFKVGYPNDRWDLFVQVNQFDGALDPALGFLPRPGTRFYLGGMAFQPRPQGGPFRWARQFFFELFPTRVDDLRGNPESWRIFMAPFNVETQSGEHLEANYAPQFERLEVPFQVAPAVIIPAGEYRFDRYRLEVESAGHRRWSAGNTVWFGGFFDGRLSQWESFVRYASSGGHLRVEARAENDFGHLPEGDFIQRLLSLATAYAFTPDLVLSILSQYDSETRDVGLNARLRWTVRPGNDLFLVWNHEWQRPLSPEDDFSMSPSRDELVAKARWTFRK